MKIGIAVTTTPNREGVFNEWHKAFMNTTNRVPLYVHNDTEYKGVVYSKNKCIEALAEYDYQFYLDDDCKPVVIDWIWKYINSGLEHACWNYNRSVLPMSQAGLSNDKYIQYEKPNGCMLFASRKCIEVVGGFDTDFKGYGYEHVNWSDRIYNNGLTPARYIDIPNSKGLFEMADCESSFSYADRAQIPANYELYQQKYYSKEFKPFKS